jgi:chromosome segregation ATPase
MSVSLTEIQGFVKTVNNINSIEGVKAWDTKASEYANVIADAVNEIDRQINEIETKRKQKTDEVAKTPFFKKLFLSNKELINYDSDIKKNQSIKANLLELKETLESWIERTPDSLEEAKQMIKELSLIKKELTTKKKEMTSAIKEKNISVRQNNANLSNQVLFVNSKLRQIQRIGIRMEKEAALKPLESQKALIEHQIIDIEKCINWIERIMLNK